MQNDQYTFHPLGDTHWELIDTIPWTPALLLQRWQTSTKLERQNLLGRHDVLEFMEELLLSAVSADDILSRMSSGHACMKRFSEARMNVETPYPSDVVN